MNVTPRNGRVIHGSRGERPPANTRVNRTRLTRVDAIPVTRVSRTQRRKGSAMNIPAYNVLEMMIIILALQLFAERRARQA